MSRLKCRVPELSLYLYLRYTLACCSNSLSFIQLRLIYVTIALGLHSFSLHIHNDTLQALSRREDMFTDNSIQLKPFLAIWVQS